jgi:hypothetical protein
MRAGKEGIHSQVSCASVREEGGGGESRRTSGVDGRSDTVDLLRAQLASKALSKHTFFLKENPLVYTVHMYLRTQKQSVFGSAVYYSGLVTSRARKWADLHHSAAVVYKLL